MKVDKRQDTDLFSVTIYYFMKKGDRVFVLDDAIDGVVLRVEGSNVYIETSDGFEMEFSKKELINADGSVSKRELGRMDIDSVLLEKSQKKPKNAPRVKPKERNLPAMQVDLHIEQLVRKVKGLSNYDILNIQMHEAKRQMDFAISKRIQKVVFIHGVGEGVLRAELESLFGRYDNLKFYDADFQKYGRGATEVYFFQNSFE